MQPVQKASDIGSATLKHLKRASEKDNFLACLRPNSSNGGKRVDMLWFNFILGSNFLSFCFKLIIMLLSYITIPKNKRKENLNPVVCRGFQTKEDSDSPPLSLSGNSLVTHSPHSIVTLIVILCCRSRRVFLFPCFLYSLLLTYIHTCFLFPSGYSYGTRTSTCICYSYGID